MKQICAKTAAGLALALLLLPFSASPLLAQSPPEAELAFSTGVMHLREGRVDLALDSFKRAVKGDPKNPYFQKGLGQAYAARREWSHAISSFRKALELNPYYVDAKNDLGYALIMSGDREAGKQEFMAAYGDPTNPAPEISAFNLGRAFLEEKNFDQAATWFRTSTTRNKTYSAPYVMLAETLAAVDRLDEAIAQLEAGAREIASDPELLLALARAYAKAGRSAEARARFNEVVKADAGGPFARHAAEQLAALPK